MRELVIALTALSFTTVATIPVIAIASENVAVVQQKEKKINCKDGEIWSQTEKKCVRDLE